MIMPAKSNNFPIDPQLNGYNNPSLGASTMTPIEVPMANFHGIDLASNSATIQIGNHNDAPLPVIPNSVLRSY